MPCKQPEKRPAINIPSSTPDPLPSPPKRAGSSRPRSSPEGSPTRRSTRGRIPARKGVQWATETAQSAQLPVHHGQAAAGLSKRPIF